MNDESQLSEKPPHWRIRRHHGVVAEEWWVFVGGVFSFCLFGSTPTERKKQIGEPRVWKNKRGCCSLTSSVLRHFPFLSHRCVFSYCLGRQEGKLGRWYNGVTFLGFFLFDIEIVIVREIIIIHPWSTMKYKESQVRLGREEDPDLTHPSCHQTHNAPFPKWRVELTPWVFQQLCAGEFRRLFQTKGIGGYAALQAFLLKKAFSPHHVTLEDPYLQLSHQNIQCPGHRQMDVWPHQGPLQELIQTKWYY